MGRGKSTGGASTSPALTSATSGGGNIPTNAVFLTDSEAQQLRDLQNSQYDANTTAAVKMYISNTDFDGDEHSLSQTMNYLLEQGVDLTDPNAINAAVGRYKAGGLSARDISSIQYTNSYMSRAVHDLGKDTKLIRGAHEDILQSLGVSNYSRMSESQLQAALIGKTFQNKAYMSTSYDAKKNPFLSSSSGVSGGREVVLNINAGSKTKCLFGAKAQAEIVLNKGTNFKITGVSYTGATAAPRGRSMKPQVQIDIETF